jgi:phosphatidylglycerol:prolipoprotein diacylglycerol transferase
VGGGWPPRRTRRLGRHMPPWIDGNWRGLIPYFPQPVWHIGRLEIHEFGIAAAIGLNAGYFVTASMARRARLNQSLALNLLLLMIGAGVAGGHAAFMIQHPGSATRWFRIWDGQSAVGLAVSLLLAACGIYGFLRRKAADPWPYLNLYGFVVVVMWTCVRAGCALAHDHPGRRTTSWLGVRFPGGSRFDLGLLEFLAGLLICILFVILKQHGFTRFLGPSMLAVGATRLALIPFAMHVGQPHWVGVAEPTIYGVLCVAGLVLLPMPRVNHGTKGMRVKAR